MKPLICLILFSALVPLASAESMQLCPASSLLWLCSEDSEKECQNSDYYKKHCTPEAVCRKEMSKIIVARDTKITQLEAELMQARKPKPVSSFNIWDGNDQYKNKFTHHQECEQHYSSCKLSNYQLYLAWQECFK